MKPVLISFLLVLAVPAAFAQTSSPKILSVQAHPDDETMYSAALYALTHHLQAELDVVIITDGSGGFDYAMLAEPLYGKPIAAEPEARSYLPAVRKKEFLAAGEIFGLRNVFFLDEYDHRYMLDADTVLQHVWDVEHVKEHLRKILDRGDYDFVFTLLPHESEHGHHKAASILALEAVAAMKEENRPAVLGGLYGDVEPVSTFDGLADYPITSTTSTAPAFIFDRRKPLEVDSVLTYHVVVNWHIGEYKSQGVTQRDVSAHDTEQFWMYDVNGSRARKLAGELFERLNAWKH